MKTLSLLCLLLVSSKETDGCNPLLKLLKQCPQDQGTSLQRGVLERCHINLDLKLKIALQAKWGEPVNTSEAFAIYDQIVEMAKHVHNRLNGSDEVAELFQYYNQGTVKVDMEPLEARATMLDGVRAIYSIINQARLCSTAQLIPTEVEHTLLGWASEKCPHNSYDLLRSVLDVYGRPNQTLDKKGEQEILSKLGRALESDMMCSFDLIRNYMMHIELFRTWRHYATVGEAYQHVSYLVDQIANIEHPLTYILWTARKIVHLQDAMHSASEENYSKTEKKTLKVLLDALTATKDESDNDSEPLGEEFPPDSIQESYKYRCRLNLLEALRNITDDPMDTPGNLEEFWQAMDRVIAVSKTINDVFAKDPPHESQAYYNYPDPDPANFAKKNYDFLRQTILSVVETTRPFECAAAYFVPVMVRSRLFGGMGRLQCGKCAAILYEIGAANKGLRGNIDRVKEAVQFDLACVLSITERFVDWEDFWAPQVLMPVGTNSVYDQRYLTLFHEYLSDLTDVSGKLMQCLKKVDDMLYVEQSNDTDEKLKSLRELLNFLEKKGN